MERSLLARCCRIAGAAGLLVLAACGIDPSVRPASPAEQCRAWGYAPDDPECLRVFRRYGP